MTYGEVMEAQIRSKLIAAFAPDSLEIIDDSASHAGHKNAEPGGGTHYTVKITAAVFDGLARPARHRLVYEALSEELSGRLHALSISAKSPDEA